MNPLRKYKIELTDLEIERLHNAANVLHGVAALKHDLANEDECPAWWSDFHEGALIAALQCAADVLSPLVEKIEDQQADPNLNRGKS
ncbi:hypothetical protein [Salinisphaera sp. Q1T1-3]|uniref:hypothetical protein n=1 Tax=Salinisphaera sp. Q1T1-3 TaxID=2321229 RepID=UPI000E715820|nr:hypothetical protein [Salinisphaera sp. Q1T1-3]RJS95276.1 hypothetical protein D3260_01620 [Salinisphaera sp. Q1T1-3]